MHHAEVDREGGGRNEARPPPPQPGGACEVGSKEGAGLREGLTGQPSMRKATRSESSSTPTAEPFTCEPGAAARRVRMGGMEEEKKT